MTINSHFTANLTRGLLFRVMVEPTTNGRHNGAFRTIFSETKGDEIIHNNKIDKKKKTLIYVIENGNERFLCKAIIFYLSVTSDYSFFIMTSYF